MQLTRCTFSNSSTQNGAVSSVICANRCHGYLCANNQFLPPTIALCSLRWKPPSRATQPLTDSSVESWAKEVLLSGYDINWVLRADVNYKLGKILHTLKLYSPRVKPFSCSVNGENLKLNEALEKLVLNESARVKDITPAARKAGWEEFCNQRKNTLSGFAWENVGQK